MDVTRRHFALMSALGLGAGAAGCSAKPSPEQQLDAQIAGAEKLLGVDYTDAERAQLRGQFEGNDDARDALRAWDKPNGLAPAGLFDPRLPGKVYENDLNKIWESKLSAMAAARVEKPGRVNILLPSSAGNPDESQTGEFGEIVGRAERGNRIQNFTEVTHADLAFASVEELGARIRAGDLTSSRLTQIYLDRIAKYDPQLEAFITVTTNTAIEQALQADKEIAAGNYRGPLHGIPFAAKDLLDTAGIKTTYGAMPYKDRVPDSDAAVIERLREAGAVMLGKTSLGALAYGDIWFGGRTNNPWNTNEGSSGSSAGSCSATAAGLCAFAIGTETLGSIISPSTRCGTTGLRPTFGRVSRHGAMALCWSMDKIGPITRYARDTALVLSAINRYDPRDSGSIDMPYFPQTTGKTVIGYDPSWFENASIAQNAALKAARETDAEIREIKFELPGDFPLGALNTILFSEAAAAFEHLTLDGRDDDLVWQDENAWPNSFRAARFISAIDLIQAQRLRRAVMEAMDTVFEDVDMLISPPFAGNLLSITNYTGHPALVMRAGFTARPTRTLFWQSEEGGEDFDVPDSIVLWGRLFEDITLTQMGQSIESGLNIASWRPDKFKN